MIYKIGLYLNGICSAEYILDVVGAGATAMSKADWHLTWKQSPQSHDLQEDLDLFRMSNVDRVTDSDYEAPKYATTWTYQLTTLLQRDSRTLWRDPTYLMAKMAVNVFCALVIGFTYWKSHSTIQGTQNKLFVSNYNTELQVGPDERFRMLVDLHLNLPCCTPRRTAAGPLPRDAEYLRDPRATQSHV